jgi:DNA-binding CsgD family transcriptional regulator/PAS domain-containing protein
MSFVPDASTLIGQIYDAMFGRSDGISDSEGAWCDLLKALAEATRSSGGAFTVHDPRGAGDVVQLVLWNYPSEAADEYLQYYRSVDVWLERGRAFSSPGNVDVGAKLLPRAELARTEYFNDYLRRWNTGDFLAITAANNRDRFGYLVLYRPVNGDDYATDEIRLMTELRQHVVRAMRMGAELARERGRATNLMGLLDRLASGIFILDEAGRVIFANATGERLIVEADGLGIEQSRLTPADASARAPFEAAVAAARTMSKTASAGKGFLFARPSGRTAYRVEVVPLQPGRFDEGHRHRGAVLVWIDDPSHGLALSQHRLRELYSLGPGEARLVLDLAAGKRLADIADERGIARSTLKTQLERIYAKTGIRRQGDLARLWAGLVRLTDKNND